MDLGLEQLIAAAGLGLILGWLLIGATRKKWILETMSPREHFELGKEKARILDMRIADRKFHGIKAGRYTVLLTHGTLDEYSKGVYRGLIERIYSMKLSQTLLKKKFVTEEEKRKFFGFLTRQLPELTVKDWLITADLVSPDEVLERYWEEGDERDEAWAELRQRRLVDPKVLWVRPYPPEEKLKEIMTGVRMLPLLIDEHERDLEKIAESYRESLIEVNHLMSSLLTTSIPLMRYVVESVSDPMYVFGLIVADRAQQISGLGLQQIAEKGGMDAVIAAAKNIINKRKELNRVFAEGLSPEEAKKLEELTKQSAEMRKAMEEVQKAVTEIRTKVAGATSA